MSAHQLKSGVCRERGFPAHTNTHTLSLLDRLMLLEVLQLKQLTHVQTEPDDRLVGCAGPSPLRPWRSSRHGDTFLHSTRFYQHAQGPFIVSDQKNHNCLPHIAILLVEMAFLS